MSETYYRVHWADCPEFSAANAWSMGWGAARHPEDSSRYECPACDGEGCENCGSEGYFDAQRGYSCVADAEALIDYMAEHGTPGDDERVIVFTGRRVGNGGDGEPLVVPDAIVETVPWAEFAARVAA